MRLKPGIRAAAIFLAAALLALAGCSAEPAGPSESGGSLERFQANFLDVFDTVTSVVGYAESEEAFSAALQGFHDELKEYHQLYDIYNDYDGVVNIKTINDNAGGDPVEVDGRIIDLLLFCRDMYERTGGRTNVMMGSVLSVWHDYRESGIDNPDRAAVPSGDELAAADEHSAFDALVIDEAASTVLITDSGASLDVGAVAKGYAVQKACEGLPSGWLVSVGGNVCGTGPKPDGSAWVVGIQNPDGELNDYQLSIDLDEGSIVSSGDYQRYYTAGGVRYCHIIDPDTLFPPEYWRAVSVVYPDSGVADALSTALFTLDRASGLELLESFPGAEVLWINAQGEYEYTEGFAELIHE